MSVISSELFSPTASSFPSPQAEGTTQSAISETSANTEPISTEVETSRKARSWIWNHGDLKSEMDGTKFWNCNYCPQM